MANEGKKRNLGRGLSALLGEEDGTDAVAQGPHEIRRLPVEFLTPGRFQPRQTVDDEPLRELAQSIADKGVLQPLLVRADPAAPDRYEIIAGERRWRAAQLAQVHEVPVILKQLEDSEELEIALIENLQREDLSALDEAHGFQRLKDEFAYTQAELAASLGKSRSHVANTMRLLNLPEPVKSMIGQGALTAGHARALLNADDPAALARAVARRGLNVRQTEKLVQKEQRPARPRAEPAKDADTVALENELANMLGLKVGIAFRGDRGTMTIQYQSLEQLDDILFRLSQGALGTFNMNLEGADGGGVWTGADGEPGEEPREIDGEDGAVDDAAALEAADEALEFYSEDGASLSFADTSAAIANILADKGKGEAGSPDDREEAYAATSQAIDDILANADEFDADAIDQITADIADAPEINDTAASDSTPGTDAEPGADAPEEIDESAAISPDADEIDKMLADAELSDGETSDADPADEMPVAEEQSGDADVAEENPLSPDGAPEGDEDDLPDDDFAVELSEADAAALLSGIAEGLGLNDIPTDGTPTGDLSADDFLIDDDEDPLDPKDPAAEE